MIARLRQRGKGAPPFWRYHHHDEGDPMDEGRDYGQCIHRDARDRQCPNDAKTIDYACEGYYSFPHCWAHADPPAGRGYFKGPEDP